ncbi:hypothetical protein quinque_011213 [Culex quinquefasciatus]
MKPTIIVGCPIIMKVVAMTEEEKIFEKLSVCRLRELAQCDIHENLCSIAESSASPKCQLPSLASIAYTVYPTKRSQ